ncbi:(2Fe-2S)-binding protein [Arachidicoccus ginsenosidivorans]|uniref:(2Fe-2S)-binding protein n=1 Tax=Arachidicoccus ginsenosidivorans TaxID=496057 RepID=UPI001CEF6602|nr:(2Fe-2S)-binding protein [Arachidicoccus ginsenosidivorans]
MCSCGNVGEGNIKNKIKEGITELGPLCQASGAGMGCGSCRPEVQVILESVLAESTA